MKVVVAPDKFKGSLSARDVAGAIARGIGGVDPSIEVEQIPMADGGEGTVDALVAATGGRRVTRRVTGPLPEMRVNAMFGMLGDGKTAVIEMAAASGLHLLRREQYDPMATTTFGTGELLLAAVEEGARRIILGIGGSATIDGGVGCAQACGVTFEVEWNELFDARERPLCGGDLVQLNVVPVPFTDRRPALEGVEILVACDVSNPLCGEAGAAAVFGPQKGAAPDQVRWFDDALDRLARASDAEQLATLPGAGAAGGLGFGMMAFFGGRLQPGFQIVADAVRLRERLRDADLVITGEGRLDASSLGGKTAVGVARVCRELGVPCVALVGSVGAGAERAIGEGMTAYFSICDRPMSLDEAMRGAPEMLARGATNLIRFWRRSGPFLVGPAAGRE